MSISASCKAKSSLILASDEACRVSGYEATSTLLRVQPRFSYEAKDKEPISTKSEAPLPAEATLSCEVRVEAPLVLTVKLFRFKTEHCSIVVKHQVLT